MKKKSNSSYATIAAAAAVEIMLIHECKLFKMHLLLCDSGRFGTSGEVWILGSSPQCLSKFG
jgi:hypothetical protein